MTAHCSVKGIQKKHPHGCFFCIAWGCKITFVGATDGRPLLPRFARIFCNPVVFGAAAFGVFALLVAAVLIFCRCVRPIRAVAMHVAKLLALVPTVVFLLWLPLFFILSPSACRIRWGETPSPDGAHIAYIMLEDYGAMAASGYACIRNRTIGDGIFRLEGVEKAVYTCRWSTAWELQLQWTDNSHLQVLAGDEVVKQASVR